MGWCIPSSARHEDHSQEGHWRREVSLDSPSSYQEVHLEVQENRPTRQDHGHCHWQESSLPRLLLARCLQDRQAIPPRALPSSYWCWLRPPPSLAPWQSSGYPDPPAQNFGQQNGRPSREKETSAWHQGWQEGREGDLPRLRLLQAWPQALQAPYCAVCRQWWLPRRAVLQEAFLQVSP